MDTSRRVVTLNADMRSPCLPSARTFASVLQPSLRIAVRYSVGFRGRTQPYRDPTHHRSKRKSAMAEGLDGACERLCWRAPPME